MATYTCSEFHLDEASRLVDLVSTRTDLQDAVRKVHYLLNMYATDEQLALGITEAFCTAILIKYGRAFGSSVRANSRHEIQYDLPKEIEDSHEYFLNWRDKHLAHSVNNFELGRVQARYCAERLKVEGITDVTVAQAYLAGLSTLELEELARTAQFFIDRLSAIIDKEKAMVLKIIRAMPIDDVIAKNQPAMIPMADRNASGQRRRQR